MKLVVTEFVTLDGVSQGPGSSTEDTSDGRELQVHGSARLGGALLSTGLVDTLRLVVAPVVLGSGRRLLIHPATATGLRLVRHEAMTRGLLVLEYDVTGAAVVGEYEGVTDLVGEAAA